MDVRVFLMTSRTAVQSTGSLQYRTWYLVLVPPADTTLLELENKQNRTSGSEHALPGTAPQAT
jgi:hypothetical protein